MPARDTTKQEQRALVMQTGRIKKIPGSLVMAIIEIRNEFSLSCSVFCLRGCQVTQVAHVQEAIGNEELECERELTLAN